LKKLIKDVFAEYGIPVKNLYTATTDNGADVLLAVKLLLSLKNSECNRFK
jgi:hypothetical protein